MPHIRELLASLQTVEVNPFNRKCKTLPVLSLRTQYSRNLHLSWLGFWVAFLSWFAFSPLIPEAVKNDLNLTKEEIGNSNIVSLCATLGVRLVVGPLVDRFGPRKVMTAILIIGAIPSGLAGTVSSVQGLYLIRFFIGILGGTFVPCQAWTSAFFDSNVVGSANALVAGWGNSGGGFTFIIMVALYDRLRLDGLSEHSAWRAAFAIVPVPALLTVAVLTLVFGTDHPNDRWEDRHIPCNAPGMSAPRAHDAEKAGADGTETTKDEKSGALHIIESTVDSHSTELDIVVPETSSAELLTSPVTWLPAIAYLTTFGYELAIDANLANVLFGIYSSPTFGQTKAGYIAGVFGLLNIVSRPFGGYLADAAYANFGIRGKKYLTLACGALQGVVSIALGVYIDSRDHPSLAVVIAMSALLAILNEMANGANFALVPHCFPKHNGSMTGIVGAMGNAGGIIFALIFRYQPLPYGKAFWISGILAIAVNALLIPIPIPRR